MQNYNVKFKNFRKDTGSTASNLRVKTPPGQRITCLKRAYGIHQVYPALCGGCLLQCYSERKSEVLYGAQ